MRKPSYNDKLSDKDLRNIDSIYKHATRKPLKAVRKPNIGNRYPTMPKIKFMTDEEYWETPEYKAMRDRSAKWAKDEKNRKLLASRKK